MSLINEALQRAEQDAQQRQGPPPLPPGMTPAPQMPPAAAGRKHGPPAWMKVVALVLLLNGLIAGGLYARKLLRGGPSQASAHVAPPAVVSAPKPTAPAKPAAARFTPETEAAYERTLDYLEYYDAEACPIRPVDMRQFRPASDASAAEYLGHLSALGVLGKALGLDGSSQPKAEPPAPAGPAAPAGTRIAAKAPPAESHTTPPPPARPARRTAPRPPARRGYKLSGIMQGANGGTAIINGALLQVGQSIDGAKLIEVHPHSVTLDADGERIHLNL